VDATRRLQSVSGEVDAAPRLDLDRYCTASWVVVTVSVSDPKQTDAVS